MFSLIGLYKDFLSIDIDFGQKFALFCQPYTYLYSLILTKTFLLCFSENSFRCSIHAIVTFPLFDVFIMLVIVASSISLAAEVILSTEMKTVFSCHKPNQTKPILVSKIHMFRDAVFFSVTFQFRKQQ